MWVREWGPIRSALSNEVCFPPFTEVRISHTERCHQSCARSSRRYRVLPSRRILSRASAGTGAWSTVITETRHLPQHSHLGPPLPAVASRLWLVPLNESSSESFRTSSDQPREDWISQIFLSSKIAPFYRQSRQHLRLTRLPPPYQHPGYAIRLSSICGGCQPGSRPRNHIIT